MKISCISVIQKDGKLVAIECAKGRGIIFPGGNWERDETFEEAAARELEEETGLIAVRQSFIFGGATDDEKFTYAFLTEILEWVPTDLLKGKVVLATWDELLRSKFCAYYSLVKRHLIEG